MFSPKLESYLRAYRIRTGLTQRDVAALLGLETGSTISRAEKGAGIPSVPVLLGYCVLFEAQPEDLVPGMIRDIEKTACARATLLAGKLKKRHPTQMVLARLKFLENLSQLVEGRMPKRYEQGNKGGCS
jgi:transcriptional regulator with XRE-family HTH domain